MRNEWRAVSLARRELLEYAKRSDSAGIKLGSVGVTWTPAVCGGTPTFPHGPPPWPPADPDVREALVRCYADGSWGRYHGPSVTALEARLREFVGVDHVMVCSSGTVAVEVALRGLAVGPGDEVILAGYDYPGNFRAIEAVGARPVLVDVDPSGRCLDVDQAIAACGPQVKAVIATHLHGGLIDMPRLYSAMRERGVGVVEDACQVSGAGVAGRPAGAWGDVGTFSFGGSKLLTAGRGGAVVTPRGDVMQRMKIASERGNQTYPLSELQAAVLLPQLEKLPELHRRRFAAAARFKSHLQSVDGLEFGSAAMETTSEPAYYKLGFLLDRSRLGDVTRESVVAAVRAEGIALDAGFRGFVSRGSARCRRIGDLPHAARAAVDMVVLHHPILLEADDRIDRAAHAIAALARLFSVGNLEIASQAAPEAGAP